MNRKIIVAAFLFVMLLGIPAASMATMIASMEQISPVPTTYTLVNDFYPFLYTGVGDVTAPVEYAGLGSVTDFAGFAPGTIALIERGTYTFEEKVINASNAGAVGALIYDSAFQDDAILGTLQNPASLSALFVTRDVGLNLLGLLGSGGVVVHMVTYTSEPPSPSALPEPSTALLFAAGLFGVGLLRKRIEK